jgi:hypothetical protein
MTPIAGLCGSKPLDVFLPTLASAAAVQAALATEFGDHAPVILDARLRNTMLAPQTAPAAENPARCLPASDR